ncbi:MAG: DUF1289 domain-containing protein [Gammaproteobacteria bacterium]|nr:DUF1289 domain-containing protein [Gammaproteobacteria bacterium]
MLISSPCIRNCCLNQKDICIGCFRHVDEIIKWQSLSDNEKLAILKLTQNRKKQQNSN